MVSTCLWSKTSFITEKAYFRQYPAINKASNKANRANKSTGTIARGKQVNKAVEKADKPVIIRSILKSPNSRFIQLSPYLELKSLHSSRKPNFSQ